ncbi:MAG: hypothetical protein JNJ89_16735, partial [Rubrivivax sp.]|nr:hypothetical protein [Rubrivivax sp.]
MPPIAPASLLADAEEAVVVELGAAEDPGSPPQGTSDAAPPPQTSASPPPLATPGAALHVEAVQLDLPLQPEPAATEDIRTDPNDMPSFVRAAERAARWRRPGVRAALAVACLAAGIALVGQ